jgi:hypothetical protein
VPAISTSLIRPPAVLATCLCACLALDTGPAAAAPGSPPPAQATGPDLVVVKIDRSGVTADWQALSVGGELLATVTNEGDAPTGGPFQVTAYEERDGVAGLGAGDQVLGQVQTAELDPGEGRGVKVALAGDVMFRDSLLAAFADSANVVAEANEANNVRHTGQQCSFHPATGAFQPVLEWQWTGSQVLPTSRQVMMTPAVIDVNADGVPDVVFSTYTDFSDYSKPKYEVDSHLRAISGDDGHDLWTVTDAHYDVEGSGSVAAGDIDGDGLPEIVVPAEEGDELLAFENDGTFKWRSPKILEGRIDWGGASLADLDADGVPEIVIGNVVLNADGTVRWQGRRSSGRGENGGTADPVIGPLSVVADLDLDGVPEVVGGNTAYRNDGAELWTAQVPDGFPAIANFDDDPYPEIALVACGADRLGAPHLGA